MLRKGKVRAIVTSLLAGALLALLPAAAAAQCVMCRASLNTNSAFLRSFNIGVLVLLVPPVSIFCAIFLLAIRQRKHD